MTRVDPRVAARLYERSGAARWDVSCDRFTEALEQSVARGLKTEAPGRSAVDRYLGALHLEDLALACACADGHERAWEHFVLTLRPVLYRAADAIDPSGSAREAADSLYADLFGTRERDGERQSLLRYFHGRSSLATWLRAVLSQRHVDALRASRRSASLSDEEDVPAAAPMSEPDPDRPRFVQVMQAALTHAVAVLAPRDRLRLNLYYLQQLTLAQIGRITSEHEATVSRGLTRTRATLRREVEVHLQETAGLAQAEIEAAFASIAGDAGPLDLGALLASAEARKIGEPDRSI